MSAVKIVARQILFEFLVDWNEKSPKQNVLVYSLTEKALMTKIDGLPAYIRMAFNLMAMFVIAVNFVANGKSYASLKPENRKICYLKTRNSMLPPVRDFCLFVESFAVLYWSDFSL